MFQYPDFRGCYLFIPFPPPLIPTAHKSFTSFVFAETWRMATVTKVSFSIFEIFLTASPINLQFPILRCIVERKLLKEAEKQLEVCPI